MENGAISMQEKVKTWLKDNYNLALLGRLIFAAVVLLHYFSITKFQTLWWDKAEYMPKPKNGLSAFLTT